MVKRIIEWYFKILDEKLESWTFVILIIAILVVIASYVTKNSNTNMYLKSNIIEHNFSSGDIIIINWKSYKLME